MAEITVGLGEDEDATEKLITACGVQLGQCQENGLNLILNPLSTSQFYDRFKQEPILSVSKIKTRQCCLDCHKFSDEIGSATMTKLFLLLLFVMLM